MKKLFVMILGCVLLLVVGCAKHKADPGPTPDYDKIDAEIAAAIESGAPDSDEFYGDIRSEAADYPKELAAAKRAGIPLMVSDLAKPLPPANQNAATIYHILSGPGVYRGRKLGPLDDPLDPLISGQMPTAEQIEEARKGLADNADLLKLVHEAATRPKCVFDVNWSASYPDDIIFPDLIRTHFCVSFINAQSLVFESEGRADQAVENEALGFRIADHAASLPVMEGYLYSIRLNLITLAGMQKILYLAHGGPKIARLIEKTVKKDWHPHSMVAAQKGETAYEMRFVSYLRHRDFNTLLVWSGKSPSPRKIPWGKLGFPTWGQFVDANGAFLLREQMQAASAAAKPYTEDETEIRSLSAETEKPLPSRYLYKLLAWTGPGGPLNQAMDRADAEVTLASAAVLAWKGAHATYPSTLSQAIPNVPIDPFGGKLLRYKREGAGFVIYSVGPTGKFDGGTPTRQKPINETLFRYPLPAYLAAKK